MPDNHSVNEIIVEEKQGGGASGVRPHAAAHFGGLAGVDYFGGGGLQTHSPILPPAAEIR
ncbi:MAG: hypothetical protein HAW59_06335, partial [Betaproteobacteria bacterium]|nr:hypothetical protein [Betaproteobacteria bacterium]